jgi:ribosomal protein S12 methylthiotransferase accessory factor
MDSYSPDRMTTTSVHPRFVRADIVRHPDGGLVVTTPRGRALRVHMSEAELIAILGEADGQKSLSDVAAKASRAEDLLAFMLRLQSDGCLTTLPADDATDWVRFTAEELDPARPARTSLVVLGHGQLVSVVKRTIGDVASARFREINYVGAVTDLDGLSSTQDVLVVVLLDRFDVEALRTAATACEKHGLRWSFLYYADQRGWFGPHMEPGRGPSFDDLYARRIAAASDQVVLRAMEQMGDARDDYVPPALEVIWMLSAFLVDVERWLVGAQAQGCWHQVEVDTVEQVLRRHPVLPLPDSPREFAGLQSASSTPEDLIVDERCGIVKQVRKVESHPTAPRLFTMMQASACDISRIRPWQNDPVGGGSSFGNAEAARGAAIGEAIERYCGNIVQHEQVIRASYQELTGAGELAVDPDSLVLFSPTQYGSKGFPFVPLRRDSVIHWFRGHSLTRQQPAWLPASLVYVNWYRAYDCADSPTNGAFYPGIAAGVTLAAAITSGLQELIERHATMVWWLNSHPLRGVRASPELQSIWRDAPVRSWLIYLENEFSVPVMAGVVENVADSLLTIGFAARSDGHEAALKAWGEALVLQDLSRDLLDPHGAYRRAISRGRLPGLDLKPWRHDRRYLDSYRPDFRDVISLLCQAQIHLDPRAHELVRPWVDVPAELSFNDLPRLESADLETYQNAIESRGYEIFYADVTTPDIHCAGLRVARVLVPGMIPNFPAGFPNLGRDIAQRSAIELGWCTTPLTEEQLNRIPLPHA